MGDRLCRIGGLRRKKGMGLLENKSLASQRVGGGKEGDLNKNLHSIHASMGIP